MSYFSKLRDFIGISRFLALTLFAAATHSPVVAQTLGCDALVPTRDSFLETDGTIGVGAAIISQRLASLEIESGSSFKYRERFPEFFSPNDIFEIERFYYIVCRALDNELIEPERKFFLFLQAERERRETLSNAILQAFQTNDVSRQLNAIEGANSLGGEYQRLANSRGIASDSEAVRGATITNIIKNSTVISGTITPYAQSSLAFSIRIGETSEVGSILNFAGWFYGGIFHKEEHLEEGLGSMTGDAFHFSNSTCVVAATLQDDRRTLQGRMNCTSGFMIGGSKTRDQGEVIFSLF